MLTFSYCYYFLSCYPQAVASILHGTEVDVEIIKRKGEEDDSGTRNHAKDHVQFAITEKKKIPASTVGGDGGSEAAIDSVTGVTKALGDRGGMNQTLGMEEGSGLMGDEGTEEQIMMTLENKISPLTFCNAFPFHLIFDRNLIVRQVSHSVLLILIVTSNPGSFECT